MECPTCGQPLRIGSRLCTGCGSWLLDDDGRFDKSAPSFGGGSASFPSAPRQAPQPAAPTAQAAPASSLWAPPSAAQRVDQPPPPGSGVFSSGFSSGSFSSGGFGAPIDDGIDEHTTLSARRSTATAFWTLSLPNGAVELVTDRAIIIGREPQFMPALPQARLIPVPDPTRSVSKNHACFSMYGATLVVEDLGSTNGIVVTRADGRENDIGVGGRTELEQGARVELGDVVITIGRA